MTPSEKVAYIKGLMDGLELEADRKETKLIKAVVDVLEDIALSLADLEDEVAVIDDDCCELHDRLDDVEDELYGEYDDDMCELTCPECGAKVCVEEDDLFDGEAVCPECGARIQEIGCGFDCENCDGTDSEDE